MKKALTILLFLSNISVFAQKKQKETVLSQQIIVQATAEIKKR